MGLYYQAILSSLLLNFLPDLPRTFFFTPQYPILFFFTLAFPFSLSFFHITADFQQVKRKNIYSFAFVRAMYFFIFFHTKVPIFCEDCRPELTEAYHNSKDGDLNTEGLMTQKSGNPLFLLRELWQLFPTHYMAHGMPTPHWRLAILTKPHPK